MDESEKNLIQTSVALICITTIEIYALSLGIDGTALSLVVAAIAGIVGYEIKAYRG